MQDVLRLGVNERAGNEWRSPIPKPNGTLLFCTDFREVNKMTQFDTYSMPRAEVLAETIEEAWFLSALDLAKGYWQVPLRTF